MDVLEQRGSSIAAIELKQAVLGILSDVIKIREYVATLFTEQGILVFLLKILFDRNICIEQKIQERNRSLAGIREMLPGLIPNIKLESQQPQ